MSIVQTLREMHPYRLLLIAALAVVMLGQAAAMVLVARSQVQKAEAREALERATRTAALSREPAKVAPRQKDSVMNVGYVVQR